MNKSVKKSRHSIFNLVLFSIIAAVIILLGLIPKLGFIQIGPISITICHIPVLIGVMLLPLMYSVGLGLTFGLSSLIASFIYAKTPGDIVFQNPLVSILPRIIFSLCTFFIFHGFSLLKNVKHSDKIMFSIVVIVTLVFFYFGAKAITNTLSGLNLKTNYDPEKFIKISSIVYPIMILLSAIFIIFYYIIISNDKLKQDVFIPTTTLLSTLIHSIITLILFVIFIPKSKLGGAKMKDIILITLSTNAFIEIIIATIIVTPITRAIHLSLSNTFNYNFFIEAKNNYLRKKEEKLNKSYLNEKK